MEITTAFQNLQNQSLPWGSGNRGNNKVKYTFKERSNGTYTWTSEDGSEVHCGVKYFWNPNNVPKMGLTTREKENAVAAALWVAHPDGSVIKLAVDVVKELEKNYTLIRRRKS